MLDLSGKKFVTVDWECFEDVDGKRNQFNAAQHLGNAVACTLSSEGEYKDWIGKHHSPHAMLMYMLTFDYIIGYNTLGFDYPLFGGELLGEYDLRAPLYVQNVLKNKTIDLMVDFREALGVRVSLANVAGPTLGEQKTMDGGFAPSEFRKGHCLEVIKYCRQDVNMTHQLFVKASKGEELKVKTTKGEIRTFACVPKVR